MNIFLGALIGLIVLMLIVLVHELGHFFAAKKNGVEVEEFGIGFPPAALKWQKKHGKWTRIPKKDWDKIDPTKMTLSLNYLPIGGFCKMKGEADDDKRKGTFGSASFWGKTKILFGGVALNWLLSIIIFTILAWTGMPVFLDGQFQVGSDSRVGTVGNVIATRVEPDSPAASAGLTPGDEIISLDGTTLTSAEQILDITKEKQGQDVSLVYIRDGEQSEHTITLLTPTEDRSWILGVTSAQVERYYSTWSAPIVGVGTTIQLTGETFKGVGSMLWNFVSGVFRQVSPDQEVREEGREAIGAAGDGLSGPVGIVGAIFPAFIDSGITNLVFLAAVISISLACMNVLPIPALDGGRWLLIAIYRIRNKPLPRDTEERIVSRAFMVLVGLIIVVTVLDITRFFG
ncbi:site-2 protease family protein [Christensenellaceae bacterium OttesenSCG-928-L17]|nr:site-2 protease family protein [Christensenellaceae bacterium OttesenSCG-928-L17]